MHNLEPWERPLVHSCLLQKKVPSPWNFHREGRLPAPDLGLFQFPLRLEDESEIVHGFERVRMMRAQLRFAACERFALQLCGLAARGGAVGAALQTSKASVRQFV